MNSSCSLISRHDHVLSFILLQFTSLKVSNFSNYRWGIFDLSPVNWNNRVRGKPTGYQHKLIVQWRCAEKCLTWDIGIFPLSFQLWMCVRRWGTLTPGSLRALIDVRDFLLERRLRPKKHIQKRPVEMWWHTRRSQISPLVFRHLNRRGRQFSRLLAAEVCASAVVMLDTPCSEVVWRVLATHCICQFPLHYPPVRRRVPSHFNWTLPNMYP